MKGVVFALLEQIVARDVGEDTWDPRFDFDARDELLLTRYRSERRLCSFAEGLLLGAADHFDERLAIEQPSCMLRGDDHCLLEIAFAA